MNDIKSVLIATTVLAIGGLGIFLYKSEIRDNYDGEDNNNEYSNDNDSDNGSEDDYDNTNKKLMISEYDEEPDDDFYEVVKPKILKSKRQKTNTNRNKKRSSGTRRRM